MQSNDFSDRLKEERTRLGLSQAELGEACGVKKLAQFNYEKGERMPDALYLMKAAALGVDVSYLLTGQRQSITHTTLLNSRERILLHNYRESDAEGKAVLESTSDVLAGNARKTSDEPAKMKIRIGKQKGDNFTGNKYVNPETQ